MTTKKQTLYEILEVPNTASTSDIKAAHRRLSLALMSGASGLSREDASFKLNVLDVALHTLSTAMLRDEYDAQIAPAVSPVYAVVPSQNAIVSHGDIEKANRVAAAMEESHKLATTVSTIPLFPIKAVSTTAEISFKSLKRIFRVLMFLTILVSVLQVGRCTLASRMGVPPPAADEVKARELLAIQEHYHKFGERATSRAELEVLKTEQRRIERERREAEFAESNKRQQEKQFVEESLRVGESVHKDLVQAERQAAYEEEERQRALEEERRQQQYEAARAAAEADEAERIYIENKRREFESKKQELGLYQ